MLPRFFVVGDQAQVGTVVFNETDQAFDASIELQATGAEFTSQSQEIEVPAHGNVKAVWDVTIDDVKDAKFLFSAKGGGLSDAEEFTLPVYRYTSPETVATAGEVAKEETRTEWVQLPQKADPEHGEVKLELITVAGCGYA